MLGLADRGRVRRLLASVIAGDTSYTLSQLDEAHVLGIDPTSLLRGLMETLHGVTRVKAGATGDVLQSAEEREAASEWASSLGWAAIHRLWQMLLKGLQDVSQAPDPNEAAAMALLRLIHAADMPDPSELIRHIRGEGSTQRAAAPAAPAPSAPPPAQPPQSFGELIDRLESKGEHHLGQQLRDYVGLVDFTPGSLVLRPLRPLGPDFSRKLADSAKKVTGEAWQVRFTDQGGEPSLHEQERMAEEQVRADVLDEPNVRALLEQFPDATLETLDRKEA
jgi:DNA polymerase-3 subunit gamma/tau